jgi:NTE family protein
MPDPVKRALVLGGGAIKGAFQAGALKYVLDDYGYQPSFIYGISVGALNGAFLADRAGRALKSGTQPDWPRIGGELYTFWEQKIRTPDDVLKKRFPLWVALEILFDRFNGIVNPAALHKLVREQINPDNLAKIHFVAGTVDVGTGAIHYAESTDLAVQSRMLDYVIASTAIPIIMPLKKVGSRLFYDGGMIDVAPIKRAIKAGATDILCVACQPRAVVDPGTGKLEEGNLGKLFERVSDILTNEILANDLKIVGRINTVVESVSRLPAPPPELTKYKRISRQTIRPKGALTVDMLKFGPEDIKSLLELGYETARSELSLQNRSASAET